jgi:hypothetical protein
MGDELMFFLVKTPEDLVETVFDKMNLLGQKFVQFFPALVEHSCVVSGQATCIEQHFTQIRHCLFDHFGFRKVSLRGCWTYKYPKGS